MRYFWFLLFAVTLYGHQTGLSFLELKEIPHGDISVVYKKPLSDTRKGDIKIVYPSRCLETTPPSIELKNGFILKRYKLWCGKEGLMGSRIWIQGLVRSDRGVLVRYENGTVIKKAILKHNTPFLALDTTRNTLELAKEYIGLGIYHILSGYDHLLFVLLLFLLAQNLRVLLWSISAFTLSHSITLACGILGIVYMPPPFIESMIALSIIFLAKELRVEQETFTKKHLGVIAFSFGLLHGFGFSSVLRDIGLPQDEIPLSLFSFNVGIELGQLLFILFASLLVYVLQLAGLKIQHYHRFLAYSAGSLASFWFLQRVLTF